MTRHRELISKNQNLFSTFVNYDELDKFDELVITKTIPKKWYHLFDIPKELINCLCNLKCPLYYKIRGYNFDDSSQLANSKNSVSSEHYWIARNVEPNYARDIAYNYWQHWSTKSDIKFLRCPMKIEHYTSRGWSEEYAIKEVNKLLSKFRKTISVTWDYKKENNIPTSVWDIQFWIQKGYTEDEANARVKLQHDKNRSATTTKYWIEKGYTEDEAKIKVSEFQSKNAKKLWDTAKNNGTHRQMSHRCKEYWISNGYTEDEAILKVSEIQTTFSLEKCIDNHGVEKGTEIWQNRQDKWQKTLNDKSEEEKLIIRSKQDSSSMKWALNKANGNEEEAKKIYKESCKKRNSGSMEWALNKANGNEEEAKKIYKNRIDKIFNSRKYYSNESIIKLQPIYDYCQENYPELRLYWKNNEYGLIGKDKYYKYDFTIKELKIIIEYNGIVWHPKQGNISWISPIGETYESKIKSDTDKQKLAEDFGFYYIILWSDEIINYDYIKRIIDERVNNYT